MSFESLRIASRSFALTLIAALIACLPLSATAAEAASRGDIVVVTVHGTATATMAGMTVPLSAGAILQLPATVRTGADGALELRQGKSTFAAAGNTELEIPQSAAEDGLIERIVQIRGNAFYNIGKRTGTRLRVEAPYLVAVIKGTQFNIAAQEDSTTIALFEGHLEVRASDDSDVVDLDAGEIAIRRRNDVSISVLRLNAARGDSRRNQELAARPQQQNSPTASTDTVAARNGSNTSQPRVDGSAPADGVKRGEVSDTTAPERLRNVDALADSNAATPGVTAKAAIETSAIDVTATISAGTALDAGVTTAVDLGAGTLAASADVGLDVGAVSADVGAGATIDIPAGAVAVDVGATVAAGDIATVDVGVGAAVDIPAGTVDVGAGATVAASDIVAVDVGAGAAVDVPAGSVDVGAGAAVGVGSVPVVDAGVAAAVDIPAGTVDVGLDTSVASTDVGAAVGVDAGAGSVGADVNVGPVDVGVSLGSGGLDVDLGLGADSGSGGGLLGGLLGRRRSRD